MKSASRFLEIDVLRAIACVMVLVGHTAEEISKLAFSHSSAKVAHDFIWQTGIGNSAVVIFFAISGFGICSSMRGPRYSGSMDFIIRRFFRLYPVFWLSMLIAILFYWLPQGLPFDWRKIIANATMLPQLFGEGGLIVVYWTLETELAFYFLCLFLFLIRVHNHPLALTTTILLLFVVFCYFLSHRSIAPKYLPWFGMPYHICIAFWGALYRYCLEKGTSHFTLFSLRIQYWKIFYVVTGMILLPALYALATYLSNGNYWLLRNSFPYISGVIGFFIFTRYLPVRSTILAEAGNYTYSIYLIHHVTITFTIFCLKDSHPELFGFPIYIYFLYFFLLNLMIGYLVYNKIEKPMMNFSKQLIKRIQ